MKRIFVAGFYSLLLTAGTVASAQNTSGAKLSLQQCVETAIANNLDVQQSKLQMDARKINWNQARLNLLPDLNGTASSGINQGRSIDPVTNNYINQQVNFSSYSLSSGVVIFNGLSMQNTIKQNAMAYEAAKMDWQQAKDNLTISVILAYLQVLGNEDLLVQANNQAGLSKSQVDRLDALNKEGAIQPSQLYDLKGQYANDQLTIINTENALEIAKVSLSRLMNIPYDKNVQLERLNTESFATRYEATPEEVYQQALANFSQVKAVDFRKQSAQRALKAVRGQLFPLLTLNGNASTNYSSTTLSSTVTGSQDITSNDYVVVNGSNSPVIYKTNTYDFQKIRYGSQLNNNLFSTVSLNLSIPIFNSWQTRNRIKLAELDLKNTEIVASTTRTQLQQNIDQAYINMVSAANRYKTLLEQVSAFGESFHAAEVRFDAGVGNSIDYLVVKNNLDRANVNLITSKYDYVLRTKVLDYYQGKQLW